VCWRERDSTGSRPGWPSILEVRFEVVRGRVRGKEGLLVRHRPDCLTVYKSLGVLTGECKGHTASLCWLVTTGAHCTGPSWALQAFVLYCGFSEPNGVCWDASIINVSAARQTWYTHVCTHP